MALVHNPPKRGGWLGMAQLILFVGERGGVFKGVEKPSIDH